MSSPADIQARLSELADALGSGTLEDVNALWTRLRGTENVLDLWARLFPKDEHTKHPVSAILTFARMRAEGTLAGGDAGYSEMTRKVIAAAVKRATA